MPPNLEESREKRNLKREFVAHKLKKKKRHKLAVAKVEQNLEKTLAQAPVQVSKVHIDGLSTTKDVMVKSVLENILKAENYGDVMLLTKAAHTELIELGCFHKAQCYKIGKKCNLKSAKNIICIFKNGKKKIDFCTRKKFKTTKNPVFFSVLKLYF